MSYITRKKIEGIRTLRKRIRFVGAEQQLEEIRRRSPYSAKITPYIRKYNELRFYCVLFLQETFITRPAIIREIDFDLWVTAEGCTNLELMKKGKPPYAFDAPEGKLELHHIGQDYSAPFAELTLGEHAGNNQLLHISQEESWRRDEQLESEFTKERSDYWKKRAKKDYVVSEHEFELPPIQQFKLQQEYISELRKTCETIFGQCEAEDLDYLSDLAKSYALMHRVGAVTMGEFLKTAKKELQAEIQCPSCQASNYVLHGSYRTKEDVIQRYKCRHCGVVFSPINKSLVSGSSFSFRDWLKFIDCLYNGYTIKQIAKYCDISEHAVHENRTRLFYALKLLNDKVRLHGNVVLDETYLPVSFKGNHSKQEDFVMPRVAYQRGGENHQKGLSCNLVCIVCAVDDSGNSVAKVAGTGNPSAAKLKYALSAHLGEEITYLYSDRSSSIRRFALDCGFEIKQEKQLRKGNKKADTPKDRDTFVVNHYLQTINGYHSRLKRFLSRFAGISTKYLSGYLYLFAWKERSKNRNPEDAYKELLLIMTEPNSYLSVDDIMKGGYLPDALEINKQQNVHPSVNLERDKEIYRRYAAGETMTAVGADYGLTRQAVSLIVQKLRKIRIGLSNRMGYKKRKEERSCSKTSKNEGRH